MNNQPDLYNWWREALAGRIGEIHADHLQCGFYKKKRSSGGWQRVAIWHDSHAPESKDGYLTYHVTVDGKAVEENYKNDVWLRCAEFPITEDLFRKIEAGEEWPDEIPGIGHNAPPASDDLSELQDQIDSAVAAVDDYKEITSDDQNDQAANLRTRLLNLSKKADKLRTDEKAPHLAASKEVDAKWNPLKLAAEAAAKFLRGPLTSYMRVQEAARLKEASEAAAKNEAPPAPLTSVKAGGAHGRRVSLRTETVVEIVDYKKCLDYVVKNFDQNHEVVALVTKLVTRVAKTGVKVPGTKVKDEKVAV